jgi:trehalose 6-phosphate phosphatase
MTGLSALAHGEPATLSLDVPAPERAAFFFDVDGTLLELRAEPLAVVSDEPLRRLLQQMSALTGGAVAFVSGRSMADIDRIFAPLVFPASGLHGAEIRYPDGADRHTNPHIMDHARPGVSRFVADRPGLMLEDKGATLAVHYRNRPELGAEVIAFMNSFSPGDELAVQEGKLVVELKPALYDKGTAITSILKRAPFAGRIPIFLGDDLTDEKGFVTVNQRNGLSIRVGAEEMPTEARYHLADPAAVRQFLMSYVAAHRETL